MGETVQRLTQARAQHEDLAQLAQQHTAQDARASQRDAAQTIRTQNDAIRGGQKTHDNPSPEMTRPDLMLASAAGLATTAADSTHMASQNDHVRDYSLSAGRSYHASVRGSISLFAYQDGMKFYAAKGRVEIQAQSDEMALTALKDFTITSTDGRIILNAAKEIWIGAGGSYIQINCGGIINGSRGPILEKTSFWNKVAPEPMQMPMPLLPASATTSGRYHEQFHLLDDDGVTLLPHTLYEIESESGKKWSGYSDARGLTQHVYTDEPESLSLTIYKAVSDDDSTQKD
jgi:type VI secretion system secreted protein VgrG